MINNDKLTEAFNEYEKLRKLAEERDYKEGWVYYKLLEKYGKEIAQEVMPPLYDRNDPGWDGDVAD